MIREFGEKEAPPEIAEICRGLGNTWKHAVIAAAYYFAVKKGSPFHFRELIERVDGVTNNEMRQSVVILPAIEGEKEYDPLAALREMPALLAPIPVNGKSNQSEHE